MSEPTLPDGLQELLERVVEHPVGFQILYRGHLESVAAFFGVHPSVLEAARAMLETPERRALFTEALVRARRNRSATPRVEPAQDGRVPPAAPPRTAEDLIRDAVADAAGRDFLFHAPPETVAVLFEVHPFVVLEAREALVARGYVPGATDEEER